MNGITCIIVSPAITVVSLFVVFILHSYSYTFFILYRREREKEEEEKRKLRDRVSKVEAKVMPEQELTICAIFTARTRSVVGR